MIASADTDTLLLRCEHYARCVSLYGDGFDSLFDDNFFDLLPGETKCIRVLPSPSSGIIYAETAYSTPVSQSEKSAAHLGAFSFGNSMIRQQAS